MSISTSVKIATLSRVLLAASFLAAMSSPCQAARKARAIFIQPHNQSLEKATLFTGSEYAEIELPTRNFSPEIDLPDGDLVLAILHGELEPRAKPPTDAPIIKIPAAWSRCLLLFFPDPSNKTFPARVIPVNASTANFPNGHTLIYNVTEATIAAKFGECIVKVMPGKTAYLKPPIAEFGAYPVAIDCTFPRDTKPISVCRSTWQHDPSVRQILFVTPNPGYDVPRIWGILDRQPEEEKTQLQN